MNDFLYFLRHSNKECYEIIIFQITLRPFKKGLDRNKNGGGILLYLREDIPCKKLKIHTHLHDTEGIFVRVNPKKTKWPLLNIFF